MNVEHRAVIAASPDAVFTYIQSPEYHRALVPHLRLVEAIEPVSEERADDGTLTRVARYTARAELPRFLKRFEDKAPEYVYWEERSVLNPTTRELRYEIVPEMPEKWRSYYSNEGSLRVEADPAGNASVVVQNLEFKVSVPGLSLFIGKALRSEITQIFEAQATVLREHFGANA
ncbi:DUF2505 family protein [Lujinxingia vulgaris]|uniref:DUF2505 family protein n=1 Tax=Lujinxingia vulgaris TaxID=2600176 RepID=A0A5C6XF14_9DELT|nr:DUF2505 family protein [Lujinxingia vulgaris]TXD42973.1 DUF2505 family protein [Lujinxingia vulgaris]